MGHDTSLYFMSIQLERQTIPMIFGNRLTISVEIPLPDHNADENNRYTDEDHYHNEDQSIDIGNDPWFRKWRPGFGFGAAGTAIDARTNAAGILYAEHI